MLKNPILVLDDDQDDQELIKEAMVSLGLPNEIFFFNSGTELINHLLKTDKSPFLILCDVNLPQQNGFDVKRSISGDKRIKYKSVPFIFWSNDASESQIQEAYDLPAQGFFFKGSTFDDLCKTLRNIFSYWTESQHPKPVK